MQSFILAGGFATRLWPLTEKRAKPLLPIAGKPLISYAVEQIPADIHITVSTNAVFGKDFESWKKSNGRKNLDILIEDAGHEGEKVGALGAIAKWVQEKKIDDDILVIAGDNYSALDMQKFIGSFTMNPLLAAHDIKEKELAKQFGTILTSGDGIIRKVTSFEEKPPEPKSTFVSTGWWILPKATLPILVEYAAKNPDNVGGIFEEFLRKSIQIDCLTFPDIWRDIGSFQAYLSLHCELVGDKRIVDSTASVSEDSALKQSVVVGPKTTIKESKIEDCIFFGSSKITDCVLTRCIIDEGCTLTGIDLTDQMVRAGTMLKR